MRTPINVTFDTISHADIIAWLDVQPNKAAAIRIACQFYIDSDVIDGDHVLDAIQRLENTMTEIQKQIEGLQQNIRTARITSREAPEHEPHEPSVSEDILAKLDNIGL